MTGLLQRLRPDTDPASCGGKAKNLLALPASAVPPGWHSPLERIEALLLGVPGWNDLLEARRWHSGDAGTALLEHSLLAQLRSLPPPEAWDVTAEELLHELGRDLLVRSSHSHEDGTAFCGAGLFLSQRVSCATAATLWETVLEVLAQALEGRCCEEVQAHGIDPGAFVPAVLVQAFLPARYGGVLHSRDPRNPFSGRAVVAWAEGAVAELVQGSSDGALVAEEDLETLPAPLPKCLAPLCFLAKDLERTWHRPADLEWLHDGNRLFVLQARPVLDEEAGLACRTLPGHRWSRADTLERFPRALTPLGWSSLQGVFTTNLEVLAREFGILPRRPAEVAVLCRGHVYADPRFFSFPEGIRLQWRTYLDPRTSRFWALIAAGLLVCAAWPFGKLGRALGALFAMMLVLGGKGRGIVSGWERHVAEVVERGTLLEQEFRESPVGGGGALARRTEALEALTRALLLHDLAIFLVKENLGSRLQRVFRLLGWSPLVAARELRASGHTWSARLAAKAGELRGLLAEDEGAAAFRTAVGRAEDEVAGRDAAENLELASTRSGWTELLELGRYASSSWDCAVPLLSERPGDLLALVDGPPVERGESSVPTSPIALPRPLRWAIGACRELVRALVRIDEEQHELSGMLVRLTRLLAASYGEWLVAKGVLDGRDQVFFLTLPELLEQAQRPSRCLAPLARRRQALHLRNLGRAMPIELPRPPRPKLSTGRAVVGVPMASGRAGGPIHHLVSLDALAEVPSGAVLVTAAPNPVLAVLFGRIAALVTQSGSLLSHAFVTAREMGLPCVAGVDDLDALPEGEEVVVDGETGLVRRTSETAPTRVTHLLLDLDGTLVTYRRLPSYVRFTLAVLAAMVPRLGLRKTIAALIASRKAIERPESHELPNATRAAKAVAKVLSRPFNEADSLYRAASFEAFSSLGSCFGPMPGAAEFLAWAQQRYRLVLATNPMWPRPLVELRLAWAGLQNLEFDLVTHGDLMHHCKYSRGYYLELLELLGLEPEQAVMLGDNPVKDGLAATCGLRTIILGTTLPPELPPGTRAGLHGATDFASVISLLEELDRN